MMELKNFWSSHRATLARFGVDARATGFFRYFAASEKCPGTQQSKEDLLQIQGCSGPLGQAAEGSRISQVLHVGTWLIAPTAPRHAKNDMTVSRSVQKTPQARLIPRVLSSDVEGLTDSSLEVSDYLVENT